MRTALLCKSYLGDLNRVVQLALSIAMHNIDDLPFYVVVPSAELPIFKRVLPNFVNLLPEEIFLYGQTTQRLPGWIEQQIVKLSFGLFNIADVYIVVDSDCQFIADFTEHLFIGDGSKLRLSVSNDLCCLDDTWMSNEQIEIGLQYALGLKKPVSVPLSQVQHDMNKDFTFPVSMMTNIDLQNVTSTLPRIREFVGRTAPEGMLSTCVTFPIYSDVMKHMHTMLQQQGLTFSNLIAYASWEMVWYVDWTLRFFTEYVETVPSFAFHMVTDSMINLARQRGVTRESLRENFVALHLASGHGEIISFY